MHQGKLVFSHLMAHLPFSTFRRCLASHRGEHKVQDFFCLDQFLTMALAQLTCRESLRDIEVNLRAQATRLYHMGFRCKTISLNTLVNANATHPWQIYADFAQHLIAIARPLYAKEPLGLALDARVYAFDATTIDLNTQIWIATCTYVLIAITKKRLHLDHHSLYEILQILSLTMFETTPINQLLTPPPPDSDRDFEHQHLALL